MDWSFLSTLSSTPCSVFSADRNKRPAFGPEVPYHPLTSPSQESPILSSTISLTTCPDLTHQQTLSVSPLKCLPDPFTSFSGSTVSTLGRPCLSHKIQLPSDWPSCLDFVNYHPSLFPSSVAAWPEAFSKCKYHHANKYNFFLSPFPFIQHQN